MCNYAKDYAYTMTVHTHDYAYTSHGLAHDIEVDEDGSHVRAGAVAARAPPGSTCSELVKREVRVSVSR